ncbi:DNA-binding GntR family transcriptional regulator [Actinocorallia herbida]|uniref:DNA-binding GntR family transcriptional regulator n=1 Tax=Actinocorallia herbida TaxID=58109 RepID=A0A3N1CMY5_9ACTN|nr:GntR family transcriptional regulator [Actinocorallia herbida]ROO82679.1 DNA-binding GntR family transcriptional regulator [Actinocorallia herbida]
MAVPRYREIAEKLAQRIADGEFSEGTQLPTETQLMDEYEGASRNTIREAIKILVSRGLVATSRGRGTFVLKEVVPLAITIASVHVVEDSAKGGGEGQQYSFEANLQDRRSYQTPPRVEIVRADPKIAKALDLPVGGRVVVRHQERRLDDYRPWSLQTSFYPMRFADGADRLLDAEDIEEGVIAYLNETLGVVQSSYRDRITARVPDNNEMNFFNLRETGSVVIVHDRFAYDQDKKPIRVTNTVYPADRNQLFLDVGDVPGQPQDLLPEADKGSS